MHKVTKKDLEAICNRINIITQSPLESWSKSPDSKFIAKIGNYHLDWAYGGVKLERMQTSGGGVEDVLHCGHTTKREMYYLMHAFIRGLEQEDKAS